MKYYSNSVYKAIYVTYFVAEYLDTVPVKTSAKFCRTTLPYDMIFTKSDASTSDEQVYNLTRGFNIHYRACIGSLIYFLSTRVKLNFSVHKLSEISSNSGKVHFKGLLHLFICIKDNNTLGLKYHTDMNYTPLSYLLRQAIINNENLFIALSDSSWHDFPDTGRSTG